MSRTSSDTGQTTARKEKALESYNLESWDDFRPKIQRIREKWGQLELENGQRAERLVLFRGQSNSCWPLTTTLERRAEAELSVNDYMEKAVRCHNELEAFTGRKWNVPNLPELQGEIQEKQNSYQPYFPCYDFLVFLRHHGFPSPFLDWTTSPYIAAYFAYFDKPSSERVAVYSYIGIPYLSKFDPGAFPQITLKGPYVTAPTRHFNQKAWYTVATEYNQERDGHMFCEHSKIFERGDDRQDILIKVTLPASHRRKALRELEDYNINHFTLFQSDDALVARLALKEFDLGFR